MFVYWQCGTSIGAEDGVFSVCVCVLSVCAQYDDSTDLLIILRDIFS